MTKERVIHKMTVETEIYGIPSKYGDLTGGVIVVETMGYFDFYNRKRTNETQSSKSQSQN
ncbi:MAG: hypothetical protein KJ607_06960 [Bacteroidetes bacterium]|nr:hypothetical protein [Bacteroidota bacterium]